MSKEIAKILVDIKSINFSFDKYFTLTSGLASPVYVDCRKIISFTKERNFIIDKAIDYLTKNNIETEIIAGGETAGIPYAAFISQKLDKQIFGPIIIQDKSYEEIKGRKVLNVLNQENKKLILSINCDTNELDVRIPGRKWRGGKLAKEEFEKNLINDFC